MLCEGDHYALVGSAMFRKSHGHGDQKDLRGLACRA